jgi:prepilin-type N-terminal cleavage/methylation domain-containing protein
MKAKTHLSQTKSRDGFTLVEMLVVIGMIAALAGISFPVYSGIQKKVEKQRMAMLFNSIERSVEDFETEYNYLPYTQAAYPNADTLVLWNDIDTLIGIIMGLENTKNFKQIKFLECPEASGNGPHASTGPAGYVDGVVDRGDGTAALYSPSGMKYLFVIDHDLNGQVTNYFPIGGVVTGKKIIFWTSLNQVWSTNDSDWLSNFDNGM